MDDEIGDTNFGVQVSIGFIGIVLTQIVGFLGSIVLARVLGPGGYGLFYVALSLSNFFKNPINGWAAACRKRIAETDFDTSDALGAVLIVLLGVAVIGGPITFVVLSFVSDNSILPIAVPILFISSSTYLAFAQILASRANFSLKEWGSLVQTVLKVIAQIGLVIIGFEVWGMIGGVVISSFATVPLLYKWINIRPTVPSKKSLKSIAKYAKWSVPGRFVGTGLSKMDIILLGWLASASVAGMYQVSLQLSMPATLVSAAVGTGLLGRISNLESRDKDWYSDYRNALSMESLLAIPVFFGSLVMAEPLIVTVFGNEYAGAGPFLIGLTLYQVIDTQTSPRDSVLGGIDRPDIGFAASLIELLVNVVLGIGLWYIHGPIGIIIATIFTQLLTYSIRLFAVWKLTGNNWIVTRGFVEQVISGGIMAGMVWILGSEVGLQGWYSVVGVVTLGGISYFLILSIISPYFRSTIIAILRDIQKHQSSP